MNQIVAKTIVVVGASGMVGEGIALVLAAQGHHVTGVGRSLERLSRIGEQGVGGKRIAILQGDVATDADASRLAADLQRASPDVIITSINGFRAASPVFDLQAGNLERTLRENLSAHLTAARHLIPTLKPAGLYLGIGGGMADLVFPRCAAVSMAQAAQRAMFSYLSKEVDASKAYVRELLLYSMITPGSEILAAEPHRITAEEVGRHVAAILERPAEFAGPILSLKSRKQVGFPERPAA
jgi:NAD(P)-dependent dehydrogenase (short-subunit alcohol dehydrogenase family)